MANIILKNGTGTPVEYKGIETIEVPQADVTIIPETEFSGFAYDEAFGLYILDAPLSLLTLEVGEKYEVIWDGATFICECQDLSAMSDGALGVGNLADFGGTGNGEPFVVAIVDGMLMLASFIAGERHTVTIAKIGGTQIFSEGVATSATVELNFTDVVEKEIYPERTLEDFAFDETWGAYTSLSEPIFDLVLGEKYKVYWDGEWYECETQDAGAIMAGALMLGNGSMFGLSGNNEPFAIGWVSAGITFLSVGSEATSHTVAVNQFVAGMEIVPNDNEVFSKVAIPKPETLIPENILEGVDVAGIVGTMEAPKPALEDVPIALDFSAGNQTINAPDGYLVKSAILQKPDTLIPGNIAKGVDIAGIVGSLVAGGGDGDFNIFTKLWSAPTATSTATTHTVASVDELTEANITLYPSATSTSSHLFTFYLMINILTSEPRLTYRIAASFRCNSFLSTTSGIVNGFTFGVSSSSYSTGSYGLLSPTTNYTLAHDLSWFPYGLDDTSGFTATYKTGASHPQGKYLLFIAQHKTKTASDIYNGS